MPASSSEARSRWKKRKREPQITTSRRGKPQPHDEDDVAEDEDDDDLDLDHHHHHPEFDEEPSDPAAMGPTAAAAAARESEVISDAGVRLSSFPSVVRHTVNRPHSSVLAILALERATQRGESTSSSSRGQPHHHGIVLENISYGQLQALSAVPADSPVLTGDDSDGSSAYVITPPPIRKGNGVIKQWNPNSIHVLPMHSDWFSPFSINRIERQVVPHFFSGKSVDHTPQVYIDCRNKIVTKYMENPAKRLSVSDCQGFIVGIDVDDITRIVRFLDNWGIINFCAAPLIHETRNDGSYLSEDVKGELCVPATALKSIDSLIQFDKPKCVLKATDVYPELVSQGHENSDLDSRLREALNESRCNHCSRPPAVIYYQSLKEIDVLLCLECFNEGRFVIGHSSLDFVKFDSTKDYGDQDGESWTDQETLSLLEGIEICNQNWNQVAEHVGTKTKAQCIVHFIRLSTDETSLDNLGVPSLFMSSLPNGDDCGRSQSKTNGESAGSSLEIHDSQTRLPFANSGNPVMSQVAFLASAVGPRVAAACAHASLAALSVGDCAADLGNMGQINGSGSGNRMNSESRNTKEGGSHEDMTNSIQQKEELRSQGPCSQVDVDVASLSSEKVRNAARAGLSAAAMKAKLFADHEEREIQRLSANIINHQLKRLELKLKQFAEVETLLMKECEQVERARQRIAAERALMSSQFGPAGVSRPTGLPGIGPAVANINSGSNSRQQVVSSSPAQPFISGYGNNQPIHPHMSQQQPMYGHGLGPRLPLTAINPSSSAVAHPMLRPVSGSSRSGFD